MANTEYAGDVQVVQYRGQILPLIRLSDFLHERRSSYDSSDENSELIQVVVFGRDGQQVGLVVKEIIDVVDEVIEVRGKASRDGMLGTAAINGQVTELFDVNSFIESTTEMIITVDEAA